ncbi:hypothetical protein [Kamptonema formosum]|uniref:hypothetical protein n=1 Tax=Kamptonema formosum TaxID=331992 RepID=UPI0003464E7F|nr:hypothetical protein [Oscillatoria sp. PCC 10802]
MTQKEPAEQELLEILELAKEAEQKTREMCQGIVDLSENWRLRAEAKRAAAAKEPVG